MTPPPLVSVVVPLFNSASTVRDTLASLRAQSLRDWHCIVVDDGSTDDGPALVRALAQDDARLELVHQANRGLAGARNAGLPRCRGRYVYFLDADDLALPGALAALVDACERTPRATGAAYGGIEFRDERATLLDASPHEARHDVGLHELLAGNPFIVHSTMLRRDLLGDDRFDERLRVGEDYDLWLRLASRGVRWAGTPALVAGYRLRARSLSRDFGAMLRVGQSSVRGGFARARLAPGPACDASPARERAVLARLALDYATMAAVAPGGDARLALGVMRDGLAPDDGFAPGTLEPDAFAAALYWGVLYGRCERPFLRPTDGLPAWWALAERWWDVCAASGMLRDPRGTRRAAAARLLDPVAIADRLLDRVPGPGVTVVGCGRNGRALIARAIERSLRVRVRDDRPPGALGALPPGVEPEPMDAPWGLPPVVTPLHDEALAPRFPGAPRWRDALAALVREAVASRDPREAAA
ncbi:MAG: glycosyltransferase [Planctomycetota bacterium]|nr:glycosyltransferase [Planctomycetota bacterium]